MYSSFFKRERQYSVIQSERKYQSRDNIPRCLSVMDDMTRLKRKKISIKLGILPQKTASQIRMYSSFFKRERQNGVIQNERKYQSRDNATTNLPDMQVYFVLFSLK